MIGHFRLLARNGHCAIALLPAQLNTAVVWHCCYVTVAPIKMVIQGKSPSRRGFEKRLSHLLTTHQQQSIQGPS